MEFTVSYIEMKLQAKFQVYMPAPDISNSITEKLQHPPTEENFTDENNSDDKSEFITKKLYIRHWLDNTEKYCLQPSVKYNDHV
ncbi:hypothetical protein J6590_058628 [Homalodisca vitripennis]|nr:hypothetical protein J6590_058628 [Homalodisca vitripennis]